MFHAAAEMKFWEAELERNAMLGNKEYTRQTLDLMLAFWHFLVFK
jgi:hypothetical protein